MDCRIKSGNDEGRKGVAIIETPLDISLYFSYIPSESRFPLIEDAFGRGYSEGGAGAAPRARRPTALPGGSGIMPAGITTGA
jgi:hypothetical protein